MIQFIYTGLVKIDVDIITVVTLRVIDLLHPPVSPLAGYRKVICSFALDGFAIIDMLYASNDLAIELQMKRIEYSKGTTHFQKVAIWSLMSVLL